MVRAGKRSSVHAHGAQAIAIAGGGRRTARVQVRGIDMIPYTPLRGQNQLELQDLLRWLMDFDKKTGSHAGRGDKPQVFRGFQQTGTLG